MYHYFDSSEYPYLWMGIAVTGFWRGVAEMMLGCISFAVCRFLKKLNPRLITGILLAVVEVACYSYCGIKVFMKKGDGTEAINMLLMIFVAVTITFSEQSVIYKLFNGILGKGLFKYSGKFSLAIYLTHRCWSKAFVSPLGLVLPYPVYILCFFAFSAVSAVLCMVVCSVFSKLYRKNKVKLYGFFFRGEDGVGE